MLYTKTKLLTPIAAALAIALVSGCAAASGQNDANPQSANNMPPQSSASMNGQSSSAMNQQSNGTMNGQSSDNMNQQSNGTTNEQSWGNQNQQSNDNMDQQATGSMSQKSWDSRNQQSKDAYREGQIWATYVVNPALQSYRINSDVQGNKVTLTGNVDTKYEKLLAGNIAQQVKGITTVDNQIKVDPTAIVVTTVVPANVFAQHVRNATTSAEVNAQLLWNEYTDGLDINVKTRDGKVTLTGVADTQKAKQRAGQIAGNTRGVQSVDNQLSVSGKPVAQSSSMSAMINDKSITDNVRSSYMFTAGMNTGDIDVDVNNGMVKLSGTVDSKMERQRAINIAQHVLGVKGVKANGLKVSSSNVAMD